MSTSNLGSRAVNTRIFSSLRMRWLVAVVLQLVFSGLIIWLGVHLDLSRYTNIFRTIGLSELYPNYYVEIFLVTKLIVAGPLILVILVIRWSNERVKKALNKLLTCTRDNLRGELIFLVVFTLISIAVYHFTKGFLENYVPIQIFTTKVYLCLLLIYGISLGWYNRKPLFRYLQNFLFEESHARKLAIFRIVFFGYLIKIYLEYYNNQSVIGQLPKQGLPGIEWLIDFLPVSRSIYEVVIFIGVASCVAIVLGIKTRFFLLINAIVVFYVIAAPNFYGKLWHNQIIIWISWILATSPCYHSLSVDSLLRKSQSKAYWIYGFPIKIIWLQFGMIYFFAGFYKLWICGFEWALGESMINQIRLEWFEHNWTMPFVRVDQYPLFMNLSGLAVIFFELFFVFLLFSNKRRLYAIVGGLFMHAGIAYVMYISFFRNLVVFYFFLLDKTLFTKKQVKRIEAPIVPKFLNLRVLFPLIILAGNLFCGVMNINSYPFSIYPVYAEIIPSSVSYLHYEDLNGHQIDIRSRNDKSGDNYESFAREEYHLIRYYRHGIEITCDQISHVWGRWISLYPELEEFDTIDVYIVEQSLNSKVSAEFISKEPLMRLFQGSADCTFVETTN